MLAALGRFLVLACLVTFGYLFGSSPLVGMTQGIIGGAIVLFLEAVTVKGASRQILSGVFGLFIGLSLASLASMALGASIDSGARLALAIGLSWIGLITGVRRADSFSLARLRH